MLQVSTVSLQPMFSLYEDFYIPPMPPDTLSDDIESSRFLLCVYVHIPALCFHWAAFHGSQSFLILGSRQRWLKQPGQSQSEPGSHPARQSVTAVEPQQAPQRSPLYRRDIKPWIIYASPPLHSLLLHLHAALTPGRPPTCRCLHL